jgi:hypothetical protein
MTALGRASVGDPRADHGRGHVDDPAEYDRACHLGYPGGITAHGHEAADRFWMGLRAAFPKAEFTLHHVIGREDEMMSPRAAVRWSLWGRHTGWGAFGAPTGAMVYVLGITHAEFGPWGLRREYTLFDETAIWKQILLRRRRMGWSCRRRASSTTPRRARRFPRV